MKTPTTTATAIPRHGASGITRSKLEVDECIAAALGEDDRGNHEEPRGGDNPPREAHDCGFERDVAQRPVGEEEEKRDDADLQHFARAQDGVTGWMTAEHSAKHAAGRFEVRSAEINPGDQDGDISHEAEEELDAEMAHPGGIFFHGRF